ncbi:uncharacterized protein DEA37_0004615 [Paragonimus westermani]|uniref:Reverse transcriptase domain-containing protein n=1 Tax=Paragonimus westermani TaxID=34504 RepID=A0A5J4NYD8_9TREM|nr:uncharacterized protein DEA37_0004615 [Paragonimus westermani]
MIFATRQIPGKRCENSKLQYALFVDFTEAFESVSDEALWTVSGKIGCPDVGKKVIKKYAVAHSCNHPDVKETFTGARSSPPGSRRRSPQHLKLVVNPDASTISDITLISRDTWRKLGRPQLLPTHHTARNASGGTLKLAGEVTCEVTFGDSRIKACCFVTDHPGLDLLGLDWMDDLKLLDQPVNSICNQTKLHSRSETLLLAPGIQRQIEELKIRHESAFEPGLGLCTKTKATLTLHPGVKPVFRPKRPVPYAALPIVDDELNSFKKKKAHGGVRICADFSTGLNAASMNYEYPLPMPEDLFTKLNGGQCFAKVELADAYLQIPVEEKSRKLLTINTHRGLF